MNSELMIKATIWEKENFELIDYLNNVTTETKITINSSGVLCRNKKKISFTEGEDVPPSTYDLVRVHKNLDMKKYVIKCGEWSKDLSKLLDEQGAFFVYNGLSLKELNKNYIYRYYKLSQGDIFKIGRLYFKVLDIHLNREGLDCKCSSVDNSVKGTMIRSSSCNSVIINGQQVIKGQYTNREKKINLDKLYFTKNDQLNNNSILTSKKSNIPKNESLEYIIQNKNSLLPRINSAHELITIKKASHNKGKKNHIVNNFKKKEKVIYSKPACRICYGEDTNDENPLICPCICKGSMKYIHYECLKNWLNSKIEEEMPIDHDREVEVITYNRKEISCELCKEKLPDYIKYNNMYYNISFYKPKFEEFIVLESMKLDKEKIKYIHLISLDKKILINIGRSKDCDLSVPELSVSRFHCMIHKEDGELYLEDNSSKFGTLVLIQNNNLIMNDLIPLRIQINRTFIKFKVKTPFYSNCCSCSNNLVVKKYDYQVQNRKCFDVLSYFIIKDEDLNNDKDEQEQYVEIEVKNNESIIDTSKQIIEDSNKDDKKLLLKIKCNKENKKKKDDILNNSLVNSHSTFFKKLNIKKGNNDNFELPKLDKSNIENFNIRDSISLISERKKNSKILYNQNNNSKYINLLKINNNLKNQSNTHSNTKNINNHSNTLNSLSFNVVKIYNVQGNNNNK